VWSVFVPRAAFSVFVMFIKQPIKSVIMVNRITATLWTWIPQVIRSRRHVTISVGTIYFWRGIRLLIIESKTKVQKNLKVSRSLREFAKALQNLKKVKTKTRWPIGKKQAPAGSPRKQWRPGKSVEWSVALLQPFEKLA
jgi:hypothetical protein